MPSGRPAADSAYFAISEADVDRLLDAHEGDARAIVREQALRIAHLEHEVSGLRVSAATVPTIPVYRMWDAPVALCDSEA